MAIIAAAVIISLSNANIMEQTSQTVFKQDMANYKETYELYVTNLLADNPTYDRTTLDATYQDDTNLFIEIFGEVEEKYQKGLKIVKGKLIYETDNETELKILKELNMLQEETEKEDVISKDTTGLTESPYIGWYADINGDGVAEGIIYADLAFDRKGSYNFGTYGEYSYHKKDASKFKNYIKSTENYTVKEGESNFGEAPMLVASGSGEDRFYIMALTDFSTKSLYWYKNAYTTSKANTDYLSVTSEDFGTGKENTNIMLTRWKDTAYGQKYTGSYSDVWGKIEDKVNEGWFIPSRAEWATFAKELNGGITVSNFVSLGLQQNYWSSSIADEYYSYAIFLNDSQMSIYRINSRAYIRLSKTF